MPTIRAFALLLAVSLSMPAWAITRDDLSNGYFVGKIDVPGPHYVAEFNVNADGSLVVFRDAKADFLRKDMECLGTFDINNDLVTANVHCASTQEHFLFEIDMRNVTKTQLERGVRVNVRSEATKGEWTPFKVNRQAQPFFPKG